MHFGIYGRKSYFKDTSDSTQMQFSEGDKYITEHFSPDEIESVTYYEDDGWIRSDMDRPDLNRLKDDILAGLINVVVIYKIDRLCCDMADFVPFYAFLKDHGVKFITIKDGIDTTTPIGEAMMYLAVIFSGLEVQTDSLRITDNMNHLAAEGFWCGGKPPIGYNIQEISLGAKSHKTLVFNEEEIRYKNTLIDIFLENHFSLQGMETYCKNHGITSLKGSFLSTTQLYSMFGSPMCVANTPAMYDYFADKGCQMSEGGPRDAWDGKHGIIVYGRTMEKKVSGKKKHIQAPPENWRVSIGYHEPYMTDERFFAIQAQFGHNVFSKQTKYDLPLLKGSLRCKCGRLMSMSRKKKADGSISTWYYCPRRMRSGVEACDMSQVKSDLLDNRVISIFQEIEHDPAALKKYLKEEKKQPQDNAAALRAAMEKCQAKIGKLPATLGLNSESVAAKYIVNEIEKLDIEYNSLRKRMLSANAVDRKNTLNMKNAMEKREEIIRLLNDFDSFTPNERNEIAKDVLKECVWDGDTLFLTL